MFICGAKPFPDVKDGRIDIVDFLEASKGIVAFVELLGHAFAPVKLDINGNIHKLYGLHNKNKEQFVTLNDIIEYEMNLDSSVTKVGIDALLWLKRALEYVYTFLHLMVEDSKQGHGESGDSLVPFFTKAYEDKLKPYHGWLLQKLFSFMILVAPSKKSLMQLLSAGMKSDEDVMNELEPFLEGLSKNIDIINDIYKTHNLDSDTVV